MQVDVEVSMAAFIFLCDLSTESECLERKLFGTSPGEAYQNHFRKIAIGDLLFLYNLDTGMLRGPFAAKTICTMNLDPKAWRKTRRNFPWQVRVDDSAVFPKPLSADHVVKIVTMANTRSGILPPSELSDEQAEKMIDALKQANS